MRNLSCVILLLSVVASHAEDLHVNIFIYSKLMFRVVSCIVGNLGSRFFSVL